MQRIKFWLIPMLAILLVAAAGPLAAEEELPGAAPALDGQAVPALLKSEIPFYHDYNLSVLYPVSRMIPAAALGQTAAGVRSLSLQDCIQKALEDNPNHRKSKENTRASIGQLLTAWGNYIPTLRTNYGLNQSNRNSSYLDPSGVIRTSGGISKSSYGNLNLDLTIFNRAEKYFELKNARYFKSERMSRLYSSELGLVSQVRQAYFNVLRDQKLLLAGQRQADQQREQQRLAEARFSVGSVTRLDVLQAQLGVRNAELTIVQYQNDLANARMNLNQSMGDKLGDDYGLVDNFEVKQEGFNGDSLVSVAIQNHPDIKTIEMQIRQQQGNLWMGRLSYLPSLSVSTGYNRSSDGLELLPNQTKGRGLGFSVGWNILDSFNRFSQNRNTEIALNNLKYDLIALRTDTERQVRANLLELQRLYQRHETLGETEQLATQSLQLQQERYRLGAASLLDLRQAQVDQSQAEINYINSVYDYHIALSKLSQSVGQDLSGMFSN